MIWKYYGSSEVQNILESIPLNWGICSCSCPSSVLLKNAQKILMENHKTGAPRFPALPCDTYSALRSQLYTPQTHFTPGSDNVVLQQNQPVALALQVLSMAFFFSIWMARRERKLHLLKRVRSRCAPCLCGSQLRIVSFSLLSRLSKCTREFKI